MNEDKVVTIEDIAKKAGVGRGTVDRVIHNRGRVSEKSRQKVLDAIDELGYKPNMSARMLARKGDYRIAAVFYNTEVEFWAQIRQGIDDAAERYAPFGMKVDFYIQPGIDERGQARIVREVTEAGYDGIAIVPCFSDEVCEALDEAVGKGVEVVTFNNRVRRCGCRYVGQNSRQGGRTAGGLLCLLGKKGCRYAILSASSMAMNHLDERCNGFLDVVRERRMDMRFAGIYYLMENDNDDSAYQSAKKLLEKYADRWDALYVTTAYTGSVARAMEGLGIKKDIFFIGHDLTKTNRHYLKEGFIDILIGQNPEYQGYTAVEAICRKLLGGEELSKDEHTEISIITADNMDF